jgi:hypothetical protein
MKSDRMLQDYLNLMTIEQRHEYLQGQVKISFKGRDKVKFNSIIRKQGKIY